MICCPDCFNPSVWREKTRLCEASEVQYSVYFDLEKKRGRKKNERTEGDKKMRKREMAKG